MPNTKQCEKRMRQERVRAERNNYVRVTLRTLSKKMRSDISLEDKEKLLREMFSKLDKAAKRNVIHKRSASRKKSRMALYLQKLQKEGAETAAKTS